jgi:predicted nucleic acid-binding protein
MPAVSNTSPISNLAIIGHLDLLKLQFSELRIPNAVSEELAANPNPAALATTDAAIDDGWIKTPDPKNLTLLNLLLPSLHRGEAEAIVLAVDLKADTIIIDEHEGRLVARQAGLSVTGVLGVLLRAKQEGTISAVHPEIRALRAKARFFISKPLKPKSSNWLESNAGPFPHQFCKCAHLHVCTSEGLQL